ncbi:MAG: PfkB family carbohydrate kinase [Nanoarchaeota archaeon]
MALINDKEKMIKIASHFAGKRIAVVGDIVLDLYTEGFVERTNPEMPGAPILRVVNEKYVLGCAGNVAANLASLGAEVYLYGILHEDSIKQKILQICQENKIKLRYISCEGKNIVKQRLLEKSHNHYIVRADHGEDNLKPLDEITQKALIDLLDSNGGYDCVVFSDYNKRIFRGSDFGKKLVAFSNEKGIPSVVDAKPANVMHFKGVTLIRPNEKEARKMYNLENAPIEEVIVKLREMTGSKYAVITRGSAGVSSLDEIYHEIPTKVREVVDVSGAGDTFLATLTLSMLSGASLTEACEIANYASGVVVEKAGTATLSIGELNERIKSDN